MPCAQVWMYTERVDVPASDAPDLKLVAARAQCRALTTAIDNELRTVKCAAMRSDTAAGRLNSGRPLVWLSKEREQPILLAGRCGEMIALEKL